MSLPFSSRMTAFLRRGVFLLILATSTSFAASTTGFNISGKAGVDFLTGYASGSYLNSTNFGYGGRVGYHINSMFEVGVLGTTTTYNPKVSGTTVYYSDLGLNYTESLVLADFRYHFPASLNALYVGVVTGIGITNRTYPAGSLAATIAAANGVTAAGTNVSWAYGVTAGYDFEILDRLSIGPQISYLIDTETTVGNGETFGDLQLYAVIKLEL